MSRYFTQKLTKEELEEKILDAWKKHPKFDSFAPRYEDLTETIEKDLSKVMFDNENIYESQSDLTGFHTTDNGLTYLGVLAGGDWEVGVFFILYSDGSKLRAYIPKDGNPWNTDTKEAYGNDEEKDVSNAKKRGFIPDDEELSGDLIGERLCYAHDIEKITTDIQNRIEYK